MTINDPEAYCASLWDWACLDGCFGDTKIKPMDIDGCIERNGKYIFIESKLPGVEIPTGQWITLSGLVKRGNTVVVVWGHPNTVEEILLMTPHIKRRYENADTDTFRDIVGKWFTWANSMLPPRFDNE